MRPIAQSSLPIILALMTLTLINGCSEDSHDSETDPKPDSRQEGTQNIDRYVGFGTIEEAADAYKQAVNDRDWVRLARLHREAVAETQDSRFRDYFSQYLDLSDSERLEIWEQFKKLRNEMDTPEGIEAMNVFCCKTYFIDTYGEQAKVMSVGSFNQFEDSTQINASEVIESPGGEYRNLLSFHEVDGKIYFSGWSPEMRDR